MSGAPPPPPYSPPPYVPQPPPKSSSAFPWVACAIIGGLAFVFLTVLAIAAIGYMIFMKPVRPPAPVSAPQMPQMVQPSTPPQTRGPLTADQAIEAVKALPEVVEWVGNVTAAGGSPHIEIDSEDAAAYTLHVYEMVPEQDTSLAHTATFGWYTVDKATGEVKSLEPWELLGQRGSGLAAAVTIAGPAPACAGSAQQCRSPRAPPCTRGGRAARTASHHRGSRAGRRARSQLAAPA